jgi:hypothetical protein
MGLMEAARHPPNMTCNSDVSMGVSALSHPNGGIYYQNVRGLRTKQSEFYDNVCVASFDIICLRDVAKRSVLRPKSVS